MRTPRNSTASGAGRLLVRQRYFLHLAYLPFATAPYPLASIPTHSPAQAAHTHLTTCVKGIAQSGSRYT